MDYMKDIKGHIGRRSHYPLASLTFEPVEKL